MQRWPPITAIPTGTLMVRSCPVKTEHNLRTWDGFLRRLKAIQRVSEQEKGDL